MMYNPYNWKIRDDEELKEEYNEVCKEYNKLLKETKELIRRKNELEEILCLKPKTIYIGYDTY